MKSDMKGYFVNGNYNLVAEMVSEGAGGVGSPGQQQVVVHVEVPGLVPGPNVLLGLDPAQLGPVTLRHPVVLDTRHAAQDLGSLPIVPDQLRLCRLHNK